MFSHFYVTDVIPELHSQQWTWDFYIHLAVWEWGVLHSLIKTRLMVLKQK